MKRLIHLAVILLLVVTALALYGCSNVNKLSFEQEDYFVLPDTTFSPNLKISPSRADYTLTSSNPKIAKVSGKQIITLQEGVTTLTVEAGGKKAEARLVVINDEAYTGSLPPIQPEYKRISFIVEDYVFSSPLEVQKGMSPGPPNPILRGGYDLDGWYSDATYTAKYDFNLPLNDDITVYAFWVMRPAEFTFEVIENKTYVSGLKFSKVPYTELTLPTATRDNAAVAGIKAAAFKNNTTLKKVTVPESYKYIGQEAFRDCSALEEVIFSDEAQLVSIGPSAFNNCLKLSSLSLPPLLTELKNFAFYKCATLDIQSLPQGVSTLEQYVFAGTATDSIDLTNVTQIFEGAFDGCPSLSTVTNTDSVRTCYKYAFRATPVYANSVVDGRVAYIDTLLVGALDNTTSFTLKEGVTLIANDSLSSAGLSNLVITVNGVPPEYVGTNAFHSTVSIIFEPAHFDVCRQETSKWYTYRNLVCIELIENDFQILRYQSANSYLYELRKYSGDAVHLDLGTELPYDIKTIRAGAFSDTATQKLKLKSLTLGNVQTIADYAINSVGTLLAIIPAGDSVPNLTSAMSISKNSLANGCVKIYVPTDLYAEYHTKWTTLKSIIFNINIVTDGLAVSVIPGSADNYIVQYFGDETTLTIPSDIGGTPINIISENALRYNFSVEHLVIGANITQIREAALAYNSIKTLEFLSQTPPTLGLYFLYNNTALTAIYVPSGAAGSYREVLPTAMHNLVQER
ncbi:MAG: leucine-rich repeat protein [Clostridia bacterium]|nr:leucine-rich repeat protein [Clostridia bacterium]